MSPPERPVSPSLGADLERRRLERRARELQRVLALLGGRLRDPRVEHQTLQRSIRDFGQQLNDVNARLWKRTVEEQRP